MINLNNRRDEGFSLIELLIVIAIIGIIAAIAVPQLMNAMDRGRQRRSMADMRNLATANGTLRVDTGDYSIGTMATLVPNYMQVLPAGDGWGTAWAYASDGTTYTISSWGSDSALGPAAPATWSNEPYEPDLIMIDGQFTQAPTGS